MQPDLGFSRWAIPLGTWGGVRVRINIWYPLVFLLLVHWLGWESGLLCGAILFVTTLVHEFFHIAAAHLTGGDGDEILLWPLGGLAFTRPAPTFTSRFWTPAAGPISQIVICLLTLPAVLQADLLRESLSPIYLPIGSLGEPLWRDVLILTFALNWLLLLVNLIPAFPLDGGQMLRAILARSMGWNQAKGLSVRVGWIAGAILAFVGLLIDQTMVVFLGFFLVLMNIQEFFHQQINDIYGEGYAGYDFADGYGPLEEPVEPEAPRPGFWTQWKQNRAAARRERELEARAATARRVDELLDKVHQQGMNSLTDEERRFLAEASVQYKTQRGEGGVKGN